MENTLSRKTRNAINKLGESVCISAYGEHQYGNGANTVSWTVSGIRPGCTGQADSAINAGRELANTMGPVNKA
jgi:hypothetical protein